MSLRDQVLVLVSLSLDISLPLRITPRTTFRIGLLLSTVHRWSHFFFLGRSNDRVLRPAVYFWGCGNDEMQAQNVTLVGGNAGTGYAQGGVIRARHAKPLNS